MPGLSRLRVEAAHTDASSDRSTLAEDEHCSDEARETPKPRPKRTPRRSTHAVRKEEKAGLLREMRALQAQMDKLQRRRALRDVGAAQIAMQRRHATGVLNSMLQFQAAQVVDVQAQFSAFGLTQVLSPVSIPIRLGRDRNQRVATLMDIRAKRLPLSRAFLSRRCSALDIRKQYVEDQRFEASNGDYCVVRLSVDQFEGARSVREVFESLLFQYRNLEISMTEKLGTVMIREDDDDMHEESIGQNRLVGSTTKNVLVETNTILFAECVDTDASSGGGYGIISAEFVDEDELYPYQPNQRVRKDISTILQLTSYTQRVPTKVAGEDDREELVVVLTRWMHTRLRQPEFCVSSSTLIDLRECLVSTWCDDVPRIVQDTLRARRL